MAIHGYAKYSCTFITHTLTHINNAHCQPLETHLSPREDRRRAPCPAVPAAATHADGPASRATLRARSGAQKVAPALLQMPSAIPPAAALAAEREGREGGHTDDRQGDSVHEETGTCTAAACVWMPATP